MVSGEPALEVGEIEDLMGLAISERLAQTWGRSLGFSQYTRVQPTVRNGHAYEAQTEGTVGTTEPVWPTVPGATVVDGSVTWKEVPGEHELNGAAAAGWQWKAGKVAGNIDLGASGASLSKSQAFTHCLEMEQMYLRQTPVTQVRLVRSVVLA